MIEYSPFSSNLAPEVREELFRIAEVFAHLGLMAPETLAVAPEFPQARQIVVADHTNWDPLNQPGTAPYIVWYDETQSVWRGFGEGGDVDLSDFYTKDQIDALLADLNSDLSTSIGTIGAAIEELTEGLEDVVEDLQNLEGDVDTVEELVAQHTEDIADLVSTFGNTAAAAVSAAAAAASQAAAIAAEAAAIIAAAGAEAARDDAVTAQVAAESANTSAGTSASAAATSASSAATAATSAASAATAAETSRVEAVAAANAAVNAAQGGVTIDAAPGALFTFETDLESWTGSNPTPSWDSDGLLHQEDGSDPKLVSPAITVNGAGYKEVVARIRRNTAADWEGRVRYSTSGHGFSGSFEVVLADPLLLNGEWQVVSWDFSAISDWTSSTITAVEVQLGSNAGVSDYDIDWIGVGNNLASLAQAAATHASNAAASATDAAASAAAADSSAISATADAGSAAGSASAAATSATSAAASSTAAASSASAANTSKLAAQTAESGAVSAQTAAVSASNSAASSAATAATSATNAATSQTAAAGSASAASTSASAASTSATQAATSATAAQASQISASTQATNAANSASAAVTSANSAAASSTAAGSSASAASGSATQAATSASASSTSANQASNSSTAAANASSNASTAATNAANSAASATSQATAATVAAVQATNSAALAAQYVGTLSAVNPLNVAGNIAGWSLSGGGTFGVAQRNVGGRLITVGIATSSADQALTSDVFQIDPAGIYEVRGSFAKDLAIGQIYFGILGDPVTNVQGIVNQAISGSPTSNPYWAFFPLPTANTWKDCVFYLCGSAVDVTKVPDGVFPPGATVLNGSGLKTLDGQNRIRLRFLNFGNNGTLAQVFATNLFVSRYDNKNSAEFKQEALVRATADSALASQTTTLQTTVNGQVASITQIQSVLNAQLAKWAIKLDVNGFVSGLEIVNGGEGQSSVVFLTDRFAIAQPGVSGPLFPFVVGTINGIPTVGITGNLVVDGTIIARHIVNNEVTPAKLSVDARMASSAGNGSGGGPSGLGANIVVGHAARPVGLNTDGTLPMIQVTAYVDAIHNFNASPAGAGIIVRRILTTAAGSSNTQVFSWTVDANEVNNFLGSVFKNPCFTFFDQLPAVGLVQYALDFVVPDAAARWTYGVFGIGFIAMKH